MHIAPSDDRRLRLEFDETIQQPVPRDTEVAWGDDPMLILMAKEEEEAYDH